jgi:hypothetical protein
VWRFIVPANAGTDNPSLVGAEGICSTPPCPVGSLRKKPSFRGALLREPGIHNPCGGVRCRTTILGLWIPACAKRRIPE